MIAKVAYRQTRGDDFDLEAARAVAIRGTGIELSLYEVAEFEPRVQLTLWSDTQPSEIVARENIRSHEARRLAKALLCAADLIEAVVGKLEPE